jgi:hypothetical protein
MANELCGKWYLDQAQKKIEPLATKYAKSLALSLYPISQKQKLG